MTDKTKTPPDFSSQARYPSGHDSLSQSKAGSVRKPDLAVEARRPSGHNSLSRSKAGSVRKPDLAVEARRPSGHNSLSRSKAGSVKKIEILAPAGGLDSVIAAVRSGADAVYMGEKSFSARFSAKNFDDAQLKEAVAYCHIHGVKAYVTLNTIVFDDELERFKAAVVSAAKADADALIVQSLGAARLARAVAPNLALHASTQMSIHTPSGVRALYEMGFKRVVLAREMSRGEIEECLKIPVELEVFIHGALCMSVSGQCYMSAMIGSRSGNRGRCAQPCRLPFSVCGGRGDHALSLKDNSLIEHIGELESMGVASAKIEGRMKRPEYVAAAVRACREQRDLGFVTPETRQMLRGVFSRTGFTDGYYTGKIGAGMFGTRTKDDVVSANEKLLSQIRASYKDETASVPVGFNFCAGLGENPELSVTDGKNTVSVEDEYVCEPARNLPASSELCRRQLEKTGGTAYKAENIDINIDDGIAVPVSVLNRLRRAALAELDKKRSRWHNYKINEDYKINLPRFTPPARKTVRARVEQTRLSPAFKQCGLVFVPLFSNDGELVRLKNEGFKIGVEIPRAMFGKDNLIAARLEAVKSLGITDVLCNNLGALYLAGRQGFALHAGFGMNFANTLDLMWAEDYGVADAELGFELDFRRINALGGNIPRGIISYGYLPLMLCRNCPVRGSGKNCQSCKNQSKLQDRKGKIFHTRCDGMCTEILNCNLLLIDEKEIKQLSTSFNILRFTVENYVENVKNLTDLIPISVLKQNLTYGLYRRGVD